MAVRNNSDYFSIKNKTYRFFITQIEILFEIMSSRCVRITNLLQCAVVKQHINQF